MSGTLDARRSFPHSREGAFGVLSIEAPFATDESAPADVTALDRNHPQDMSPSSKSSFALCVSTFAVFGALAGCTSDVSNAERAHAKATLIDRTTQGLTVAALKNLTGTYGSACQDSPGGAWTLSLGAGGAPTTLSVLKGDTSCVLTVTGIESDRTYPAGIPFDLTTSFPSAAAFGSPKAFYGTAKISSVAYDASFTIDVVFSDDVSHVNAPVGAFHSTVTSSTVTSAGVLAPDYVPSVDRVMVARNSANVVTAVAGGAELLEQTHAADAYAIDRATLSGSPSFAEVDAVYAAATKTTLSAGAITTVLTTELVSAGDDLTGGLVRTLVLHRSSTGVSSYQLITLTIAP